MPNNWKPSKVRQMLGKFDRLMETYAYTYLEVEFLDVLYRMKVRKNLHVVGDWDYEKGECKNAGLDALLNSINNEILVGKSFPSVLVMIGSGEIESFRAIPKTDINQRFSVVVEALESFINTHWDIPTSTELWKWINDPEWQFFSGYKVEEANPKGSGVCIRGRNKNITITHDNVRQIYKRKIGLRKPDLPEVKVVRKPDL